MSVIYACVAFVRNKLFDWGVLHSITPKTFSIGVGNLHMGGTGKSPMVLWLAKNIGTLKTTSVLSRGYGRKSKGYLELPQNANSQKYGDEPSMIKYQLPEIGVFVCEKRILALSKIEKARPNDQLLILDDIMQHRYLKPHHLIMLSPYKSPFYNERVVPSGKLREHKNGYKRADTIVVTKCPPTLTVANSKEIIDEIKPFSHQKVYFSLIKYGKLEPLFDSKTTYSQIMLVTGIANANGLKKYLEESFTLVKHFNYSDHYQFSLEDINRWILEVVDKDISIICTEKDAVRLRDFDQLAGVSIYYIPIEIKILFDKAEELIGRIK